ncbi:MAG: hypothetical protein LAN18_01160 [Acidobacteriia bacterium]|nr:hypothetical protein [Terriglobia bacterium]
MPLINGTYYMNPQYGLGLERAKAADADFRRLNGESGPSWLDHFLGFLPTAAEQTRERGRKQAQEHAQSDRTSDETVGNVTYNETAGLRETSKTGKGSSQDLHEARVGTVGVLKNLDANGQKLGKPLTAPTHLTTQEAKAVRNYGPAKHTYEDSQTAASKASGDRNGPTHFYLDHGQPKPRWTKGKEPKQSYGPFRNDAGDGDVPKGAKVWIRVYD